MARTLPRRADVPRADRWDVESLFPTEDAFETACRRLSSRCSPRATAVA